MQLLENIIDQQDIATFRDYWDKNNQHTYINAWTNPGHPHADRSEFIDRRLLIIKGTKSYDIIRRIVDQIWPGENQPFWANFQRQSICHMMHVDEYGKDRTNPTWTIILALDTEPLWKAVIFKEMFNCGDELVDYLRNRLDFSQPPRGDYSEAYDLQHMDNWQNGRNFNFCNWFELDGVFEYRAGDGVLFDTNQAHTTNNWVRYPQFQYRELVQIHIGKTASTNMTHFENGRGERPMLDADLRAKLVL